MKAPAVAARAPARADATPVSDAAIDAAMASVVRVQSASGRGSGFFITPIGVLTTARAVAGEVRAVVTTHGGSDVGVNVVFRSDERGVALLQVPAESGTFAALSPGDSTSLATGQAVAAIGWSGGGVRSTIHGFTKATSDRLLQIDAAPDSAAGGPVIDQNGRVLGIITTRDGQNPGGFAIAIDDVRPYLAYLRR